MAFEKGMAESKVMLRFSQIVIRTMEEDMVMFKAKSPSEYFNTIFLNYHALANASIGISVQKKVDELKSVLKKSKFNDDEMDAFIKCICEKLKVDLKQVNMAYPRECSKRFFVKREIVDYLYNDIPDNDGYVCTEEKYYNSVRDYFKAVIEEYCRLPYSEREKIYRKDIYSKIEEAIEFRYKIEITLINGNIYRVLGYRIEKDALSLFHYLVGVMDEMEASETTYALFRLSNIKNVRFFKSKKYFFSKARCEEIEEDIKKYGIQFLGDELVEVHIKLSPTGIKKYNSMIHLRPTYSKIIDEDVYVFDSTLAQIEFYFFKFGQDAVILKPEGLARKFKMMYREAYMNYAE